MHEKGAGPIQKTLNHHTYQVQLNGEMDIMDTMELDGNLSVSGSHYLTTTTGGIFSQNKLMEIVQKGEVNWTLPVVRLKSLMQKIRLALKTGSQLMSQVAKT